MRTAFIEALEEAAAEDPRIWLLTGDLGFSVLERFAARFPGRYVNVGVAEQDMAGIAAGLALSGKVVFIYSIANFSTLRCIEQIRNDIGYMNANVKVVAVGGGVAYGSMGYSHHALEDIAILRTLPNMTVVAPADPVEARLATRAVAAHDGPCYLRLGKAGEPTVHASPPDFALGRGIVLRPGAGVALISTGGMLQTACAAAERLATAGIEATVISMHTVQPLDTALLHETARATPLVVTIEEHGRIGGLHGAVAEALSETGTRSLGLAIPPELRKVVGSQTYLRERAGLSADGIARSVTAALDRVPGTANAR